MMKRVFVGCATTAVAVGLIASAASAADIPVPAKAQVIKQDKKAGFVAKLAKVVNKPLPKGSTFPLPAGDPTVTGGTMRFFKLGATTPSPDVSLPASGWSGLGSPAGSKGWKYKGAGTIADPCKIVIVKEKVIKAVCKSPGAFDSPFPYSLPIGMDAAAWELVIGSDRYCTRSGPANADVKKDDAGKGIFKAVKGAAPAACPSCDHDVCVEGSPLLASCSACTVLVCGADPVCCDGGWDAVCVAAATSLCGECGGGSYGSASQAFVAQPFGLLR